MRAILAGLMLAACVPTAYAASARPPRAEDGTQELAAPLNAQAYAEADALFAARAQDGATARARELLEQALKTSPLDAGLLWRYGRARVATGEAHKGWGRGEHFVAAEQSARAALDIDPDSVDARYWLAMALYRRGKEADALAEVDGALTRAPRDARLWHLSGDIRARASKRAGGDRETAARHYEKAADLYSQLGRKADASAVRDALQRLQDGQPRR